MKKIYSFFIVASIFMLAGCANNQKEHKKIENKSSFQSSKNKISSSSIKKESISKNTSISLPMSSATVNENESKDSYNTQNIEEQNINNNELGKCPSYEEMSPEAIAEMEKYYNENNYSDDDYLNDEENYSEDEYISEGENDFSEETNENHIYQMKIIFMMKKIMK